MSPTAFVTGASRGIGKAIALALAGAGYDVAVSARTVDAGECRDNSLSVHRTDDRPLPGSLSETAERVRASGQRSLILPMDLLDRAQVQATADRLLAEWGAPDVVVHNGRYLGPGLMDLLLDTPLDAYEKFFEAHAIAPLVLTRALLPATLARGGGTVVTISSGAAFMVPQGPVGQGGWGHAYAVGKAAGNPLAAHLHGEFKGRGIRAFNVDPGFVSTERNDLLKQDEGKPAGGGAPPAAIGAVLLWLLTSRDADGLRGEFLQAQELARKHDLYTW